MLLNFLPVSHVVDQQDLRKAVKNWTELQHFNTWTQMPGCKHGKLFIGRTWKKRADDLLQLDRHQLKLIAATLTGHVPVRGHLRAVGLYDGDPSCRFCGTGDRNSAAPCLLLRGLVCQRYNVLGELTVEPNVILCTATVKDLCLCISHTGLSKLC